jgi:hypothetical protein
MSTQLPLPGSSASRPESLSIFRLAADAELKSVAHGVALQCWARLPPGKSLGHPGNWAILIAQSGSYANYRRWCPD